LLALEMDSAAADPAFGHPIRVAGHALDIHMFQPAANILGLQASNDRATWHEATDADGADITGAVGTAVDDYREVRERPEWIRLMTEADAGGPRAFRALIGVHKLTS